MVQSPDVLALIFKNKLLRSHFSKPIISFDNTLQISSLSLVGQPEAIYQQDELFNISSDMNMLRSKWEPNENERECVCVCVCVFEREREEEDGENLCVS
jgi:hypothetical protein